MNIKKAHGFILMSLIVRFGLSIFLSRLIIFFPGIQSNQVLFSLGFSQIVGFGLPLLIYFLMNPRNFSRHILNRDLGLVNSVYIAIFIILCQPIGYFLSALGSLALGFTNDVGDLVASINNENLVVILFFSALLPAIFEEITYRGIVLSNYRKQSFPTIIVMNGLLFAIMHENLHQFLYAFVLGSFFSYLVLVTRSIFASMLAHLLFNGIQVIMGTWAARFIASEGIKNVLEQVEVIDMASNLQSIAPLLGLLIVGALACFFIWLIIQPFLRFNKVRNEMFDLYDAEKRNVILCNDEKKNFEGIWNKELSAIVLYYFAFTIFPEILRRMN